MTAIADAIRDKTGGTELLLPNQMATAIDNISSGNSSPTTVKFKDAVFIPSSNATTVDLSPWITDENINDWFIMGAWGFYGSVSDTNKQVQLRVFGPLLRYTLWNGEEVTNWNKYGYVSWNDTLDAPFSATNSDGFFATKKHDQGSDLGNRSPTWNPTTKTLTVSNTQWLGKKTHYLIYREV